MVSPYNSIIPAVSCFQCFSWTSHGLPIGRTTRRNWHWWHHQLLLYWEARYNVTNIRKRLRAKVQEDFFEHMKVHGLALTAKSSFLLLLVMLHCWSHYQAVEVWGSHRNNQTLLQVPVVVWVPLVEKPYHRIKAENRPLIFCGKKPHRYCTDKENHMGLASKCAVIPREIPISMWVFAHLLSSPCFPWVSITEWMLAVYHVQIKCEVNQPNPTGPPSLIIECGSTICASSSCLWFSFTAELLVMTLRPST